MKYPDNILETGALLPDYMGFIFWKKSARYFDGTIPELIHTIKKTGVFVDETVDNVLSTADKYHLQAVQLHGKETVEFCQELRAKIDAKIDVTIEIIKTFSIDENFDFDMNNHTITVTSGNNPQVIVNGKVITDNKAIANLMNMNSIEIEKALAEADKNLSMSYSYSSDDDDNITINGIKLSDYKSGAVSDARVQVNKMKPEMREKVKKEIERSRIQIAKSREDIAKSRADVMKAREEIAKARIETREAIRNAAASHSDKTKSEIEKVRAEIEKVKEEMAKAKEELAKEKAKQKR